VTDRIEELQRLHEAATEEWHAEGFDVDGEGFSVAECYREADASLIAAMRNALPALLRVARAAKRLVAGINNHQHELVADGADLDEAEAALAELEKP
jgi:hypothetical protein